MNNVKYNIKLYSYTGDDPAAFCRNIGELLDVPTERAQELLKQLPAVIVEGADYEKGHKIHATIAASQGLSIIEPIYEGEEEGQIPAARHSVTTTPLYYPDMEEDNEKESLRWWIWTSLLASLCGILILFLIMSFISAYTRVDRSNPAVPVAVGESPRVLEANDEELSQETEGLIADITARIQMLEASLPELEIRRTEAQNNKGLTDRRIIVSNLQNEIRSRRLEIRNLRLKLQSLGGSH
jgi:hypothetical protein